MSLFVKRAGGLFCLRVLAVKSDKEKGGLFPMSHLRLVGKGLCENTKRGSRAMARPSCTCRSRKVSDDSRWRLLCRKQWLWRGARWWRFSPVGAASAARTNQRIAEPAPARQTPARETRPRAGGALRPPARRKSNRPKSWPVSAMNPRTAASSSGASRGDAAPWLRLPVSFFDGWR